MSRKISNAEAVENAWKSATAIPAFNVPYLPAIEPIVRAIRDTGIFGLIEVARLEWMKFQAGSLTEVYREFHSVAGNEPFVGLHLDHIPVIDEDGKEVDYMRIINEALELGYQSVMIDGSRLPIEGNIHAVRRVVDMSHICGVPVEAELGAVLGHETGPPVPYEKLFSSGKGFTDPSEAKRLVRETDVDWLSIAAGNIHGAISGSLKDRSKTEARLNIEHIEKIGSTVKIPLVLHGGTGIRKEFIRAGIKAGIAKINIGTAVRQAYELGIRKSRRNAVEKVYESVIRVLTEELGVENSYRKVCNDS